MPLADTEFIRVDKEACHPFRQRAGCSNCAAICPADVINFDRNAPQASEGCIGCGRCAPACPVGAIDVRGFGEVADGTCHGDAIILECQRVPADRASPKAIRVPCLGGLTASHVLALRLAADCSPVTIMVRGWCESCPAGRGEAMPAAKVLSDASELMEGIGLPSAFLPRVQRASLLPALRDDGAVRGGLSRRGLFRRLGGGAPMPRSELRRESEPKRPLRSSKAICGACRCCAVCRKSMAAPKSIDCCLVSGSLAIARGMAPAPDIARPARCASGMARPPMAFRLTLGFACRADCAFRPVPKRHFPSPRSLPIRHPPSVPSSLPMQRGAAAIVRRNRRIWTRTSIVRVAAMAWACSAP